MSEENKPEAPLLDRIQIERVFNLGNYEHVRYSIGLSVHPGMCPYEVFKVAKAIIQNLEPVKPDSETQHALRVLEGPAEDLTDSNTPHLDKYRDLKRKHKAKIDKREAFLTLLKTLGGQVQFKDAKDSWSDYINDDDECPW